MTESTRVLTIALVGALVALSAASQDRLLGRDRGSGPPLAAADGKDRTAVERLRDRRALQSGTVGAGSAKVVVPPASYSLSLSGDMKLGGAVFKAGYPFLHDDGNGTALGQEALHSLTSGIFNTAVGYAALTSNTTGNGNTAVGDLTLINNRSSSDNTAIGQYALLSNIGYFLSDDFFSSNTAVGHSALYSNTTGFYNTSVGAKALRLNGKGVRNTAVGHKALYSSIGLTHSYPNYNLGGNTAVGTYALEDVTSGYYNTGVGRSSLGGLTTGSNNTVLGAFAGNDLTGTDSNNLLLNHTGAAGDNNTLRIGQATGSSLRQLNRAFIQGISGVGVTGSTVMVSTAGQLGVVPSSRRHKEQIQPMGDHSAGLLDLRPVAFRYRPEVAGAGEGERPLQYGLIAEEVAEVFPDLVVYDDEGQPFTVKYHLLSSLLLNELQKQYRLIGDLRARLDRLEAASAQQHWRQAHRGPP